MQRLHHRHSDWSHNTEGWRDASEDNKWMVVQCVTFSNSLNSRNIDKSVSDILIRLQTHYPVGYPTGTPDSDHLWKVTYTWLSLLNPCLHSGETWYKFNNWCFWQLSVFWTCLIKATANDCKCLNVNRIRSKNVQRNVSEQQLACWWTWSMNLTLGTTEASSASCDKATATWLRYEKYVFGAEYPQCHNSLPH